METSPNKITHAVPLEVQRVLDAMTEENFEQEAFDGISVCGTRMCFIQRGLAVLSPSIPVYRWDDNGIIQEVDQLCEERYRMAVSRLSDTATSLSDFKSKIRGLYRVTP